MTKLRPIRHLAIASDNPAKAAEFYKANFGWTELKRFGLDPDKPDEAPRPSGVFLSDGTLNIAILKFADDQLLKGVDYTGLHHFGVVVEDVNEWMATHCVDFYTQVHQSCVKLNPTNHER